MDLGQVLSRRNMKYDYKKGIKKGTPASIGAVISVKLGASMGLDPTASIVVGGMVSNFAWDWFKRVVLAKWFKKSSLP